jgi:hypothetical protein
MVCLVKYFTAEEELGRGSLSPLLFVLATDLLQSIANKAKDADLLRLPIHVGYT